MREPPVLKCPICRSIFIRPTRQDKNKFFCPDCNTIFDSEGIVIV